MTKDEALEFLRAHQPLPDDAELSEALASQLDEVRKRLEEHPTKEAVPLLLGVFGDGDGFGVYQLIEDALAAHEQEDVIPHLVAALHSESRSVRYWSTQIAARFPDERLVPGLTEILAAGDFDLRYAAITALEAIGGSSAESVLRAHLTDETSSKLRDVIVEVLAAEDG